MENKFKDKIVELRKEKGISQLQMAKDINFSRTAIASWETGVREPSFNTLILIAKYFNVSTDYLLGLEDF